MELELGLKLTSVSDEFTSDFQIAKDRAGPVFMSRETDTIFFLTAHLKGYKRRNIKIDINEDGSLIGISGEKQVQETVIVGWKVYKKEREIKGFKKVFRIPQGVILDKIKAKFNDDESTLMITMPKMVKGICGAAIEEVKDKQELVREGSGSLQIADEKSPKEGTSNPETAENSKARIGEGEAADKKPSNGGEAEPEDEKQEEKPRSVHDQKISPSIHGEVARVETDTCKEDGEKRENAGDIQEIIEFKQHKEKDQLDTHKQVPDEKSDEQKIGSSAIEPCEEASERKSEEHDDEERPQRFKLCMPIVAGSTLLLSFVVFVIQMIRSKHQTSRRRD